MNESVLMLLSPLQLEAVKEHGQQLMAAKHFEAPQVEQTLTSIVSR